MILNLISSPRNISTALMYSFAQRRNIKVLDEPFYGYYLKLSGADHPGREEILKALPTDLNTVFQNIEAVHESNGEVFIKNMAHHLIDMDLDFLKKWKNVFLIRDPYQLIASFAQVIPNPKMNDIGLARMMEIFEFVRSYSKPIVLDSNELLKNPAKVLEQCCKELEIEYSPSMLSWEAGEIHDEVPWISYWYSNVLKSTGFEKQKTSSRKLPENCRELYQEALPIFEELYEIAIKA